MAERKLDPEALREFQRTIRERIMDPLEGQLTAKLQAGNELGVEPAFGRLEGSSEARTAYQEYHLEIWNTVRGSLSSLYGLYDALEGSLDEHGASEDANVSELNSYDDALDGSTERDPNFGTPDNPYGGL
jgi:hypothetical protein